MAKHLLSIFVVVGSLLAITSASVAEIANLKGKWSAKYV